MWTEIGFDVLQWIMYGIGLNFIVYCIGYLGGSLRRFFDENQG